VSQCQLVVKMATMASPLDLRQAMFVSDEILRMIRCTYLGSILCRSPGMICCVWFHAFGVSALIGRIGPHKVFEGAVASKLCLSRRIRNA
jgi:hypothetical protein